MAAQPAKAPTADEVMQVAEKFRLPALAIEDAILAHQRPKLEVYGECVFAVLALESEPVDPRL